MDSILKIRKEIQDYFDNTSKEVIQEAWDKTKHLDKIGITAEQFIANNELEKTLQELVDLLKTKDHTKEYFLKIVAQYIVDNFNRKQEPYNVKQEGKV
jgi:hypothetical protein